MAVTDHFSMLSILNTSSVSEAFFIIPLVTASFFIHHFISRSKTVASWFDTQFGYPHAEVRLIVFQRLLAFLLFGVVPVLIILIQPGVSLSDYNISTEISRTDVLYALLICAFILPLVYFFSRKPANLKTYPLFRLKVWDYRLVMLSFSLWIVYLLVYEFMFRGILLYACIHSFGIPAALIINICMYALFHLPKGIAETLGAIPFGLVLCLLVIRLDSVWVAVFIHIILALANDWFSMKAHPEMKFVLRKDIPG